MDIAIPSTFAGEVLAYEGHDIIVRVGDSPIPRNDAHHFDTVPARSLYDDGTLGAMVSMDFATVLGEIQFDKLLGLRVKGNAPGATWRTAK